MQKKRLAGVLIIFAMATAAVAGRPSRAPVNRAVGPSLPLPSDQLRIRNDPSTRTIELLVGPVQLRAGETVRVPVQLAKLEQTGWLHGFVWDVVDSNQRALPSDLLHHVNLLDPDRRELFSPIALRVMAAGRETDKQRLPGPLGLRVSTDTRLAVVVMFANERKVDYNDVFLRLKLDYSEEGLINPVSVFPFYLDAAGAVGDKSFDVPPGESEQSWEANPAIDARILGLGGHIHPYAIALSLEDLTAGKVRWSGRLEQGPNGLHVPSDYVWKQGGIALKRGHRYRIVVRYDNPTGQTLEGMGVIAGVAMAKAADWPRVEPADPDYATDLANTLSAPERSKGTPPAMHSHH